MELKIVNKQQYPWAIKELKKNVNHPQPAEEILIKEKLKSKTTIIFTDLTQH